MLVILFENDITLKEMNGYLFFKKYLINLFRQRRKEGEREGKKYHCVVASCALPNGALACNPGMCPDWESNQQPCGLQASDQSTEPQQPGLTATFLIKPKRLSNFSKVISEVSQT